MKYVDQLNDGKFQYNQYLFEKSQKYHKLAWNHFLETGDIPANSTERWCLHHIDPTLKYFDLSRYCEWRIDDIMPLTVADHMKLHWDFQRREREYGFLSQLILMKAGTL